MLIGQLRWQNDCNAILYDCSFSEEVERVLFHPLSSRFLKESHFWGGSCVGIFGTFGPKGALGCQQDDEKKIFQREANLTISRWNFASLLFQICFLRPDCFQISPLDGGPQQLIHVKLCKFQVRHRFKKFVNTSVNFLILLGRFWIQ